MEAWFSTYRFFSFFEDSSLNYPSNAFLCLYQNHQESGFSGRTNNTLPSPTDPCVRLEFGEATHSIRDWESQSFFTFWAHWILTSWDSSLWGLWVGFWLSFISERRARCRWLRVTWWNRWNWGTFIFCGEGTRTLSLSY